VQTAQHLRDISDDERVYYDAEDEQPMVNFATLPNVGKTPPKKTTASFMDQTKNQSQYKPSIQYREKQEILVLYTRSESDSARHLWSDFERDTCLFHPNQTTLEFNNLDMDKIRSHLDVEPNKLLAFNRQ
jgi:hypothetical protein